MVFHCPFTSKAITERSTENGCDNTYRYHCMRTKQGSLTEQCLEISWIQDGKCAIYNTYAKRVDAETCNENLGICPQKQYLSNDVTSYSACVNIPEVSSLVPTRHATNATTPSITVNLPGGGRLSDDEKVKYLAIGIIAVIILAAIAVAIVCLILYRRRKRPSHGSKSYLDRDEENIKSDNEELIPMTCNDSGNRGGIVKGIGPKSYLDRDKENIKSDNEELIPMTCKDSGNRGGIVKEIDIDSFYKTKTYEHLEKLIDDSAVSILIVGEPGSGKSVLGQLLLENFRRKEKDGKYYNPRHFKCLEDVDKYESQKNTRMIYIVDDCFEDWIQYPDKTTTCMKQLHRIHEKVVKFEGNSLVLTMSKKNFENNLDAAQKAQLKTCAMLEIIDLSSDKFCLDITDKTGMLEYHRKKKSGKRMVENKVKRVTDPSTRSIVNYLAVDTSLDFQFPLSCSLFYLHENFEKLQEMFFTETKSKIKRYVKSLSTGSQIEKCQYCTLMYVVLCGGKVQSLEKQDLTLLRKIAEVKKIDTANLELNYGCCLITECEGHTYKVVHEEINKLLFTAFGRKHFCMIIDYCDIQVLMKYVRTDDNKRRTVFREIGLLIVTNNCYESLTKRLLGLLDAESLDDVKRKHVIFKNDDFKTKFEGFVNKLKPGEDGTDTKCTKKDNEKKEKSSHNLAYMRTVKRF